MAGYEETFERVEKKYRVTRRQRELLMPLIEAHMGEGEYARGTVTSLYLDTADSSLICRSLEKPLYKEKLRVRHYGPMDTLSGETPVYVEMKKKFKGVVYKRRLSLSWAAACAFLGGVPYEQACADAPLHDPELAAKSLSARSVQISHEIDQMCKRCGPLDFSMAITCERTAYQGRPTKGALGAEEGQLRVTFDDCIRYSEVAEGGCVGPDHLLLPDGESVMEIKASGAFPVWLCRALSRCGIRPTSFSKYGESFKAVHAVQGIA